jgi:hypothetical protein
MEASLAATLAAPPAGGAAVRGARPEPVADAPEDARARAAARARPRRPIVFAGAALLALVISGLVAQRARAPREPSNTLPAEAVGGSPAVTSEGAAGASFTIEAAVFRGGAQRERLAEGARVSPGDSISMTISSTESLHVYVINEDERGEAYLLFPSSGTDAGGPLTPGLPHHLPPASPGRSAYWEITSAGGREHMLLIASRERLPALERAIGGLPRPQRGGPASAGRVDDVALAELRGMGGYVDEENGAARAASRSLFEIAEPLGDARETARGVWIRRLTLENPAPGAAR